MKYCLAHHLGKKFTEALPLFDLLLGASDGQTEKTFWPVPADQRSLEQLALRCAADQRLLITRLPPFNLERVPTLQVLAAPSGQVLVLDDSFFSVDVGTALTALATQSHFLRAALVQWKSSVLISAAAHAPGPPRLAATLGKIYPPIVKSLSAKKHSKTN